MKPLSTEKANSLLNLINKSLDLRGKTKPLEEDEERVRRLILEHFRKVGRAPTRDELGTGLGDIDQILETLDSRDIIYLKDGEVSGAYPFSNTPTDFQVTFSDGQTTFAMCAIDALGIPFMFGEDVKIDSACAYCGEDIEIVVGNGEVMHSEPEDVVVFAGFECGKHAATTLCTTLVFLHGEHVKDFEEIQHGEHEILTLGEGFYVGKGVFGNSLE
jgi:hypothetical protein